MVAPLARGSQQAEWATSQKSPLAQLLLLLQVERQAVAPQMKGVQATIVGAGQLPLPSQMLGFCCSLSLQLARTEPQATPASV
jgi:hypothetical protein